MLAILIRILAGLIGTVLWVLAGALYEDEERRVQDRIQELWIRIEDLRKSAINWRTAFPVVLAHSTSSALDKLLGPELLSLQTITVSVYLSAASLQLFEIVWNLNPPSVQVFKSLLIEAAFLFCAWIPSLMRRAGRTVLNLCCIALDIGFGVLLLKGGTDRLIFCLALAASIVCYGIFLALNRYGLKRMSQSRTFKEVSRFLAANIILTVFMFLPLLRIGVLVGDILDNALSFGTVPTNPQIVVPIFGLCNLFPILAGMMIFVLMAVALIHRLTWPILSRAVYSLQRHHLVEHKTWLYGAGVVAMSYAVADFRALIKTIIE
jgi:hypothetical protein